MHHVFYPLWSVVGPCPTTQDGHNGPPSSSARQECSGLNFVFSSLPCARMLCERILWDTVNFACRSLPLLAIRHSTILRTCLLDPRTFSFVHCSLRSIAAFSPRRFKSLHLAKAMRTLWYGRELCVFIR